MKLRKIILPVAVVVLLCGLFVGWTYVRDNRLGNFSGPAEFYVYPGMNSTDVFNALDTLTVIKHRRALLTVMSRKMVDRYIKPGFYRIDAGTTSVYLARMLNNGWQSPVKLVIGGTLRNRDEIAAKIASQLLIGQEEVRAAFEDEQLLASYGFTPQNVFGLIMPDTYSCFWTASVKDILDLQKKAYDSFWNEERKLRAKELGFTQMEVSILASIVKGETNYEPEMPKVAGVYENRLRRGMLLQADPTIAFCFDYKVNRILFKHLAVDSPFNTYRHAGLPPAPIYVPTRACLDAVLYPDLGSPKPNLFFCANPDFSGTHVFAATISEHNRNARAFHRALTARRKANKR